MKNTVIALAFTFGSLSAFALSAKDSWQVIDASSQYSVVAPFAGFGPGGAFNMCATNDDIRTIDAVSTCVKFSKPKPGNGYDGVECLKYEYRNYSIPRHGITQTCVEWKQVGHGNNYSGQECLQYADQTYSLSLNQQLDVIYARGNQYPNVAFTKNFTIPACK